MEHVQQEPGSGPAHVHVRIGAGLLALLEAYQEHDVGFEALESTDGGEPDGVAGRPEVRKRPFLDPVAVLQTALVLLVGGKDDDPARLDALADEPADLGLNELLLLSVGLPGLLDYRDAAQQARMQVPLLDNLRLSSSVSSRMRSCSSVRTRLAIAS